MSVEVVMPQMGESITEGTVSKWLKQIGETIEKDEPILEISTDKVDAEVPAPGAGVLLEIRAGEGETVEVGAVVAVIGEESSAGSSASAAPAENRQVEKVQPAATAAQESQSETATVAAVGKDLPTRAAAATENLPDASDSAANSATAVVMPQMGESITEGTVSRWLKAVGDQIEKDEPLLEISTDKVDAEVPSPAAGKLLEIRAGEGETVEVGAVVALVGSASGVSAAAPTQAVTNQASANQTVSATAAAAQTQAAVAATAEATGADAANAAPQSPISDAQTPSAQPEEQAPSADETEGRSYDYGRPGAVADAQKPSGSSNDGDITTAAAAAQTFNAGNASNGSNGQPTIEDLRRTKSSPLVRNIAKEHNIDLSRIEGSGMSGRVTKKDILSFIETGAALRPQDLLGKTSAPVASPMSPATPAARPPAVHEQKSVTPATAPVSPISTVQSSVGDRVEPMSVMRKKIAEHMTFSKQTSAHVTSVYEIDVTNVARFREKNKAEFQARYGTKLTFMPFIFQAVNSALRKFPILNAQVAGDQIVYKGDVNLGMAVALDWGLIVPVIKRADTLSLSGLALAANDLADRARAKKLMPDEVAGGTFTITNSGVFGGLFGTPIINQPQVAILCVGSIEKRPKVITSPDGDDYIAIRSMAYFALTYDHRIVDGADAEKFLSFTKNYLETTQFTL